MRHRGVLVLLAAHVVALTLFALYMGYAPEHAVLEAGVVAAFAVGAALPSLSRRARSVVASMGLISASAILVHLSGGYIEAHFHFFVMLGVISLYEDWTPFLLAVGYVALHHGIVGTFDPGSVYNHAAAFADPWLWAGIHATFVLGLSAANIVTWRVTERARTRARQILESAGEAIVGVDAKGRVAFANPAASTVTGYAPEELIGSPIQALLGDAADARPAVAGSSRRTLEGRLTRKDGEQRIVEWISTRMQPSEGDSAEVLAIRDITELRRQQRDYADFIETSAIGLHAVDPKGTIVWANRADHEILGYSAAEYIGQDIRKFHARPEVVDYLLDELGAGKHVIDFEAQLVAKDGSIRHVLITSSGLLEDGRFVHSRCFTRDITDRKLAETELVAARRQAAQSEKLSALGSLVSGVAHEIRTPLTYTSTNLDIIRGRVTAAARSGDGAMKLDLEGPLNEAEEGIERINRLVGDLRRFVRLPPDERSVGDVAACVREAVELFQVTHRGTAEVNAELRPLPGVRFDRLQLQQVVLNLLENAADASPAGKPIRVATLRVPGGAELRVQDSGAGIPADVVRRIFDPFFTTKEKGTGLGLSIVQRIVLAHDGRIECDSEPGRGTTFRVLLPLAASDATEASMSPASSGS